jgi:CubicO group peptidase (beta-lactamase class C family)
LEGDFLIFHDTGRGDDALATFIAKLGDAPQLTPLGEIWSYSNASFYLAGRVIEAVTGGSYEQAVVDLVLSPLGMQRSFFFPEEVMLHRFAVGHLLVGDKATVARPWPIPRNANPAGGITTCPADLLRYGRFHMGDGTNADGARLLTKSAIELMQAPTMEARADQRMGLAWFIQDLQGVRLISHGGGTNGQIALLLLAPERQFALAVMTNASSGDEVTEDIAAWALERYLGLIQPDPTPIERTVEALTTYAGRYTSTLNEIELTMRDGALHMQMIPTGTGPGDEPRPPLPPTPLAFYQDDKIVALEGPLHGVRGEFLRLPSGSIAWLRLSGRLHRRA